MERSHTSRLESRLAALLGRRHCVIVGRATTAIYIALRAFHPDGGGKVILPTLLCPSPANAVLYAGMDPIFADVDLVDGNLSVEACAAMLERERHVVALLVAHLYGHPADMRGILELAARHRLAVIEDAAQALGGTYEGRPLGSFGDVSIISFGHTKIIDAGWGGALLTDQDDIAEFAKCERERLPARTSRIQGLAEEYRRLYYALKPLADENEKLNDLFLPLPDLYRELYLFGCEDLPVEAIDEGLDNLSVVVDARRRRAAQYANTCAHPAIVPFRPREGWIPWRHSFLLMGRDREPVLQALREQAIDASAWYPPVHRWYRSGRTQQIQTFSNAERIGREVVNLWVDPQVSFERINTTCRFLQGLLDNSARRGRAPKSAVPVS